MKTHLRIARRKAAITRSKRAPNRVVDATGAGKHKGRAAARHSKRPEPELNTEDAAGG